jgi:hypothetical protein
MLAVYLIPHSANGSELDLETGEVVTGSLLALIGLRFRNKSIIAKLDKNKS